MFNKEKCAPLVTSNLVAGAAAGAGSRRTRAINLGGGGRKVVVAEQLLVRVERTGAMLTASAQMVDVNAGH